MYYRQLVAGLGAYLGAAVVVSRRVRMADGPRHNTEEAVEGPVGTVICAENLAWMRGLRDGIWDLVYIDPPFMTNSVRTEDPIGHE